MFFIFFVATTRCIRCYILQSARPLNAIIENVLNSYPFLVPTDFKCNPMALSWTERIHISAGILVSLPSISVRTSFPPLSQNPCTQDGFALQGLLVPVGRIKMCSQSFLSQNSNTDALCLPTAGRLNLRSTWRLQLGVNLTVHKAEDNKWRAFIMSKMYLN